MKVTEKEKAKTRVLILDSAVNVIIEKGFKSASMREIARDAGVGDATIYNYFPTKEKLLYGYCEHIQQKTLKSLQEIEDFHEYSLHEQLHQLIDTQLQLWLPAREFLQEVFTLTYHSPSTGSALLTNTKNLNTQMVKDMLESAIQVGEIPDQPYQELLPKLFWDYQTGVLAYWLKDSSDGFANTTQFVDKSMIIITNVLHQGLIGKSLDLISFFFRTHIMNNFESLFNNSLVSAMSGAAVNSMNNGHADNANAGQETGEEQPENRKRPFMQDADVSDSKPRKKAKSNAKAKPKKKVKDSEDHNG